MDDSMRSGPSTSALSYWRAAHKH